MLLWLELKSCASNFLAMADKGYAYPYPQQAYPPQGARRLLFMFFSFLFGCCLSCGRCVLFEIKTCDGFSIFPGGNYDGSIIMSLFFFSIVPSLEIVRLSKGCKNSRPIG